MPLNLVRENTANRYLSSQNLTQKPKPKTLTDDGHGDIHFLLYTHIGLLSVHMATEALWRFYCLDANPSPDDFFFTI